MKPTEQDKMSEQHLDTELVSQAQQGKMQAFELLVNRYQQRVANVISKFVKDRHEIQDVAQEVLLRYLEHFLTSEATALFIPGFIALRLTLPKIIW